LARKGVEIVQKLLLAGESEQKRTAAPQNPAAQLLEATGCLRELEQLSTHSNIHLSTASSSLLQAYFESEQAG